jgi:hypothetical protein
MDAFAPSGASRRLRGVAAATTSLVLALAGCTTTGPTPSPVPSSPASSGSASASPTAGAVSPVSPDFDGDGSADLVVGDNGFVRVRYANGGAVDINSSQIRSDTPTSIDFGDGLLARDLNHDGFTDLVVADPHTEGAEKPGVSLFWIFGSATGLDVAGRVMTSSTTADGVGTALALVTDPKPVLIVGGYALGGREANAVLAYDLGADGRPVGDAKELTPASLGLPDLPADARFGAAVAATGALLAIGAPRADVNAVKEAGAVYTVDFGTEPLRAHRITQDSPMVPDNAQPGDLFGAALAAGDGYLVVGVPGEDRPDEFGHVQARTGMVQPFRISGQDLTPQPELDQNELPGDVEKGDGFGSAISMARPCPKTVGVLVGAYAEAIGTKQRAGSVWLAPLGSDAGCGALQLWDGSGLGPKAASDTWVGSAVTVQHLKADGDTLVIVAQGDVENGTRGRVLTLDYPYRDEPVVAIKDLKAMQEYPIVVSSPED